MKQILKHKYCTESCLGVVNIRTARLMFNAENSALLVNVWSFLLHAALYPWGGRDDKAQGDRKAIIMPHGFTKMFQQKTMSLTEIEIGFIASVFF